MARRIPSSKSWIEISAGALHYNYRALRAIMPKHSVLAPVVKANAYGHGIETVVPALTPLLNRHNDWLCVDSVCEARAVRQTGFSGHVLVMGYIPPSEYASCFDMACDIVVYDPEVLTELEAVRTIKQPIRLHIEIETGLHRHGVTPLRAQEIARHLRGKTKFQLCGIMTHHANSEDVSPRNRFVRAQYTLLMDTYRACESAYGRPIPYVHSACSAGVLAHPDLVQNLFRAGIAVYGYQPSNSVARATGVTLKPSLTWKSVIDRVETINQGETVGYGRAWKAKKKTVIATVPVGYADGYPRALGERGSVEVGGVACPIVGRICMNMCMVDVSALRSRAKRGSEVILLSPDRESEAFADAVALKAGTINYELVSRISPLLPRVLCR